MEGNRRRRRFRTHAFARRRLRLETLESRRLLASIVVDTDLDVVDGDDGVVSLREAIEQTNAIPGADSITFDADVFSSPRNIDLALGQLRVTDSLQIIGPGRDRLTIDAGGNSRLLEFFSYDGDLTLVGMTLTGGLTTADDVNTSESGGAIRFGSAGRLTLDRVDLSGNGTQGDGALGGGVFADPGDVSVIDSSITANRTDGEAALGGGIFVRSGSLEIVDSVISGNGTSGFGSRGGGVYSSGSSVSLIRSSISDNRTELDQADGGALWSSASLTIASSRIDSNRTLGTDADGGAIFSTAEVSITESDLSNNSTAGIGAGGGAIAVDSSEVTITRSSITGNQTASQFSYGGGAFFIRANVEIVGSTISQNAALGTNSDGGGLAIFFAAANINGSTITDNESAGRGGGLLMIDNTNRRLALENVLVAGNRDDGTAPDFFGPANPGLLTVKSSLVGDNTGTTLDESQQPSADGNLIGDPNGAGRIDPRLGGLRLAGTTRVHPLLPNSPALNAGDNLLISGELTDQRGDPFVRIFGGTVDIGAFESQVLATSLFLVDTLDDELNFQNDVTSLREALTAANGDPGHDVISFAAALQAESARTIDLTDTIVISDDVTVQGESDRPITLNGIVDRRVVDVLDSVGDVTLRGLIVQGGRTAGGQGGGAGIRFQSDGDLALIDSIVRENQTAGDATPGGGIAAPSGTVRLTRSVVTHNETLGDDSGGGGVHAARLVAIDSTVSNNATAGSDSRGGGIEIVATDQSLLQFTRSTVSGNVTTHITSHGGGIALSAGNANMVSSTISGNRSGGDGGGVYSSALSIGAESHQVLASTIAQNHSVGAGGGVSLGVGPNGLASVSNSVIASNTSDASNPDLDLERADNRITLVGSLIGDNAGTSLPEAPQGDASGNLIGSSAGNGVIDPGLAPLANRGGRTASHALLDGSPAIDAGRSDQVQSLTTDQRGEPFVRQFDGTPDIGSYETQRLAEGFLAVNTVSDENDFDYYEISLREAIELSAASSGVDTIRFDPAVFSSAEVIQLVLGPLLIHDSVVIEGPGAELLTIDAGGNHRVFDLRGSSLDASLQGLTATGGRAAEGSGGGIRFVSDGTLELNDVALVANRTVDNDAGGGGLAVENGSVVIREGMFDANETAGHGSGGAGILIRDGQASITASTIQNNRTVGDDAEGAGIRAVDSDVQLQGVVVRANQTSGDGAGGAGISTDGGTLNVSGSHVDDNRTLGASVGGGLKTEQSNVEIVGTSITRNQTEHATGSGGGAAFSSGSLQIINSTLSNNIANGTNASGGGLLASNVPTRIVNSTITENSAGFVGGGIAEVAQGRLDLENSIVAANIGPANSPDLFVSFSNPNNLSTRFSLIGDRLGTQLQESQTPDANGNRIGSSTGGGIIDPMISPLRDNGGLSPTHLPLNGSPVIDAGNDDLAIDADGQALESDGRGAPLVRRFGTVDQGAIEVQPPQEPIVVWDRPGNIFVGTPLTAQQLNATSNTAGTFVYTPAAGEVLAEGDDQTLSVQFIPDNTDAFATTSAAVLISVVQVADRGDAPESYGTLHADDGPQHASGGDLRLGEVVDAEPDGQPSPDASGDGDDDDGVQFITTVISHPERLTLATVQIQVSRRGKLDAWIDFDHDGQFDHATEHLSDGQSFSVSTGTNRLSFAVPVGAAIGTTFARFRLSTDGGLLPTGLAADGEVEDYAIEIVDGLTAPLVTIDLPLGRTTLKRQGDEFVVGRDTTDLFRAPITSVSRFEFQGTTSSNVLTIDATGGDPIPAQGFRFDGFGGVNTIRMVGAGFTLDLTSAGTASVANIDVIDLFDPAATVVQVDASAARAMDPNGNGVVIVGDSGDQLVIADGPAWRMAAPTGVAGFLFSEVRLPDTFIQLDFAPPWQNLAQSNDINNDGTVTAADALVVINELARRIFSTADSGVLVDPSSVAVWPNVYYDQNGDGRASALDALRVINEIARDTPASGEWVAGLVPSWNEDDETEDDRSSNLF